MKKRALAAAALVLMGTAVTGPAAAATPATPSATNLDCGFPTHRFVDVTAGGGRIVTLTDTHTGERVGRARVVQERYAIRGGSGEWVVNDFGGASRHVVTCSALAAPYELTLSLMSSWTWRTSRI